MQSSLFDQYCFGHFVQNQKSFILLTCGKAKIMDYLRYDAHTKDVKLTHHWHHFINICDEFEAKYNTSQVNLIKMMELCLNTGNKPEPIGRTRASYNCAMMCYIVNSMTISNYTLSAPEVIAEGYLPSGPKPPLHPDPNDPCINALVRVRGLPYSARKEDVTNFFSGCKLAADPVIMMIGPDGRVNGECFVRFQSESEIPAALAKNKEYMGSRYVEVFRCDQGELARYLSRPTQAAHALVPHTQQYMEAQLQNQMNIQQYMEYAYAPQAAAVAMPQYQFQAYDKPAVLRARGLPWSTTVQDVVTFFARYGVKHEDVVMGVAPDGRASGDCYIQFDSDLRAEEARQTLHYQSLGNRYIELFTSSKAEMMSQRRPPYASIGRGGGGFGAQAGMYMGGGGGSGYSIPFESFQSPYNGGSAVSSGRAAVVGRPYLPTVPEGVLRLRGLPYSANEQDLVAFFNGYAMLAVLPATAPINGRPSGEAYVEFVSAEEASRAYHERNRALMGNRYIELFPARKADMLAAAQGADPNATGGLRSKNPIA